MDVRLTAQGNVSDAAMLAAIRSLVGGGTKVEIAPVMCSTAEVESPAAVEAAAETPAEAAPPRRVQAKPVAKKKGRPKAAPVAADVVKLPEEATAGERVLALLKKAPMTSGELVKAAGVSSGSVYAALSAMRQRGEIETREDETDGYRKNFLKG